MNRATSVYQISFPDADNVALNTIVDLVKTAVSVAELAGSGFNHEGVAFIRIRVASDDIAKATAEAVAGNLEFSIRTGHGVHQRSVL